ncbi:ABC transporter substrate-binding protein [Sphingomonas sp. 8AM]|uniref:ABC transporter substrate-binding protein n=1 Tax=Sphingomonas sp. 8AM TaxID=2653170 RepID=UPI0012F0B719|nr:ABC transporter substrate-binding protein [Sphingomonas sp. 8AM]VXC31201.1 ABC transporter substrate-binding protein [Sphingomonas sp. 8AM]
MSDIYSRIARGAAIALAMPVLIGAAPAREPRVVSINPCLDAILMTVADPAQIAAVSHYSHDPRATSVPLAWARRFPATSGTAEEVVALRPDLVVASGHVAPATVAALTRMHIRLQQFDLPASIAESAQQVRDLAAAVGHPARGAALARRITAAAQAATVPPLSALIFGPGGLVPGAGTLPDEMLRRAGFRNASAGYGLKRWDVLPLEYLLADPPRVVLSVAAAQGAAERMERHRALRRLGTRVTIAPFAGRLMNCGGPTIVDAMARLRAVRAQVAA